MDNNVCSETDVPEEIPDRNGALDSLANLESLHQIAAHKSGGNDSIIEESDNSESSRDGEDEIKRRARGLDEIDDSNPLSNVLNQHELDKNVIEASIGRKQYECRKCGLPLKGHICSFKSELRDSGVQKSQLLQGRNRWRSRETLSDDGDRMRNTDDESSWGEGRDTRTQEIWSKRSKSKIPFGGRRLGSASDLSQKIKRSRLPLSSDNDADRSHSGIRLFEGKSQSQGSITNRRVYLCRQCGVPRKGHICLYDPVHNGKGPSSENLSHAHILTEEIRLFLRESRGLSGDRGSVLHARKIGAETKLLQSWATDVYSTYSQVKELTGTKSQRVERKTLGKFINKERDALMALKSKIRQIQNDCRILEERIATLRQEKSTFIGASNFLNAIDKLR